MKKCAFVLALATLAGLVAIPTPTLANKPSLSEVSQTISSHETKFHLHYLASKKLEGRRTATKGAKLAGDYIAAEFRRYGLQPAGDGNSYFQKFSVTSGKKVKAHQLVLDVKGAPGKDGAFERSKDYDLYSYTGEGKFSGPLVFAGYGSRGRKYSDYQDISVKDKVVVVLNQTASKTTNRRRGRSYNSPRSVRFKAMMARHMGAQALLVATDKLTPFQSTFGRRTLGIPVLFITKHHLKNMIKGAGKDLGQIEKNLKAKKVQSFELGGKVTGHVDIEFVQSRARNVMGFIPGSHPQKRSEVIVIGAHYDHLGYGGRGSMSRGKKAIHFGADDNASGTSALLEVAEAFSIMNGTWDRTLMFVAFSGEELGLLGSAHYVEKPKFPIKDVVAMLNMDMVGRLKDNKLTISGGGTAKEFMDLIKRVNGQSGMGFKLNLAAKSGFGPSDHTSFYKKKVPVMHFFTGLHKDYHKPSDIADKANHKGAARVAQFVFWMGAAIDSMDKRPTYVLIQTRRPRGGRGRMPYFGIIPEYGSSTKGLRITGVSGGGPAQKAGLKGGDIIVQMGKVKVKNIYDFSHALRSNKAGDKVDVWVLRKGKKLKFQVTLGRR